MRSSVAGTAERRQVSGPARAQAPLAGPGAHFTHIIVTLAGLKKEVAGLKKPDRVESDAIDGRDGRRTGGLYAAQIEGDPGARAFWMFMDKGLITGDRMPASRPRFPAPTPECVSSCVSKEHISLLLQQLEKSPGEVTQ
ncbi:unnamed protein product [Pleuronectes platessa]|uniref:Uncharacterized protein n=1 Tax=Pleuronectes platessa TaxID=8262 RepID=A0A9N7TLR8_PLEPL|nr:unnamed protein product [Pleuronectes platessa]